MIRCFHFIFLFTNGNGESSLIHKGLTILYIFHLGMGNTMGRSDTIWVSLIISSVVFSLQPARYTACELAGYPVNGSYALF